MLAPILHFNCVLAIIHEIVYFNGDHYGFAKASQFTLSRTSPDDNPVKFPMDLHAFSLKFLEPGLQQLHVFG